METDWGMFFFFAVVCLVLAIYITWNAYRIEKLEEEIKKLKRNK